MHARPLDRRVWLVSIALVASLASGVAVVSAPSLTVAALLAALVAATLVLAPLHYFPAMLLVALAVVPSFVIEPSGPGSLLGGHARLILVLAVISLMRAMVSRLEVKVPGIALSHGSLRSWASSLPG